MRLLPALLTGLLVISPAFAADVAPNDALLNQVTFQLNTEQWVTTKTALVSISVNAGVSDVSVDTIQNNVLGKLSKFAPQDQWHIISLDRMQDQSGLEQIHIVAQARLASSGLAGMREKAKALSKPGEMYTLDNIQYIPSEDEIRAANVELRGNIYQQAKDEMDRLNKAYPDQKYYIHYIDFVGNLMPMQRSSMMAAPMMAKVNIEMSQASLAVGNKLSINATVTLASASNMPMPKA